MATNRNSSATRWTGVSLKLILATAFIAALTAVAVELRANAATVGFAYLIAILVVALGGVSRHRS